MIAVATSHHNKNFTIRMGGHPEGWPETGFWEVVRNESPILGRLSANLTLPDYVRVARHPPTIGGKQQSSHFPQQGF
jgi:hypothetical protein